MLLFPTLSKTSARWPNVALLPSCCFHEIKRAFALSRLVLYSSSRLWIFDAEMSRFEPTTRQQVPTSSLMSESCNSVTSSFLGSGIVPEKNEKDSYSKSLFFGVLLNCTESFLTSKNTGLEYFVLSNHKSCQKLHTTKQPMVFLCLYWKSAFADRLTFCQPIRKC